jgi:hypothetical protein
METENFLIILNKQKCHFGFFAKTENRGAEQFLPGELLPVGVGMWG